jgi:hypothetical protein
MPFLQKFVGGLSKHPIGPRHFISTCGLSNTVEAPRALVSKISNLSVLGSLLLVMVLSSLSFWFLSLRFVGFSSYVCF